MKTTKEPKKLIGLTGPYCAGKNHIAHLLEQRGLAVLDVDKLGHQVITTEKECLVSRFGADILDADGLINRKLLGAKVFGKPEELAALEAIVHPGVNREILDWINARPEKAAVINAALLHRTSAFEALDAVIVVQTNVLVRLLRARRRDRLPWGVLLKRFSSQRKFSSQYSAGKADIYKVENSGFFGFAGRSLRGKTENRISKILSLMGIE